MGTKVQIRKATHGDLDRVVELYDAICDDLDATFNYPGWTRGEYPARWTAEQALANGELYVCADGKALLGTCILNGVQPEGYQDIPWQEGISPAEVLVVHTLAVHPSHLREGVSGHLLRFAEQYAQGHGKRSIRLDVYERNVPGIRLYERHGYHVAGKTDLHLGDNGPQISRCYEKIIDKGERLC